MPDRLLDFHWSNGSSERRDSPQRTFQRTAVLIQFRSIGFSIKLSVGTKKQQKAKITGVKAGTRVLAS